MKSLVNHQGRNLVWSQPKFTQREFELHDGDDLMATLKWHRAIGSLATGDSADGSWTLKREGFLHPRVRIRDAKSSQDVCVYEAGWAGGGRLLFPDGRGYFWRQRSFWHNEWAFEDEKGGQVMRFRTELFNRKQRAQLTMLQLESGGLDHPLLSILGLYLLILSNEDAAILTSIVS